MSDLDDWFVTPAIPTAKIAGYLLNVDHLEGGPKAHFFLSRGFTLDDTSEFIEALFLHCVKANLVRHVENGFTTKLIYEAPMPMPDGSAPTIRSVWRLSLDEPTQTLVTAYRI